MNKPLSVAIVGSGWVSCNRHLPALARNPDVNITGMVAQAESLELVDRKLLSRYGISKTGTNYDSEVIGRADAVMIGTPPTTYKELVLEALRLGKHVLVEKPMTLSVEEADHLVDVARSSGKTLAVVHNLNFCRSALRARQLLETGKLGELRAVLGLQSSNHLRRLPRWYPELPLGLFTDEAAHLIYLMQSFLPGASLKTLDVGPAVSSSDNTPDAVSRVFRSADGRPGTLHMSFVGAISEWALILQGDRRTAVIDLFRDILIVVNNDRRHLGNQVLMTSARAISDHLVGVITSGALMASRRLDYGNSEVVRRFVKSINSGDDPQRISAVDGRAVVSVISAAHDTRL